MVSATEESAAEEDMDCASGPAVEELGEESASGPSGPAAEGLGEESASGPAAQEDLNAVPEHMELQHAALGSPPAAEELEEEELAWPSPAEELVELKSIIASSCTVFSVLVQCGCGGPESTTGLSALVPDPANDTFAFEQSAMGASSVFFRLVCAFCLDCPPYGIVTRHSHSKVSKHSESLCIECFLYEPSLRTGIPTLASKTYKDHLT